MLVAGDFNSVPGSPAHTLLVKGKIDASMMVRMGAEQQEGDGRRTTGVADDGQGCGSALPNAVPRQAMRHRQCAERPAATTSQHVLLLLLLLQDAANDPLHLLKDQKMSHSVRPWAAEGLARKASHQSALP